jgi:aryl-alcohol dehydrogenase-like predicted oxidoreductase
MYGNEELVGRAVAAHRDQVTLCSKFGVYWAPAGQHDDWSVRADPATVRSSCDGSLRRLNVETIDLYYLHHRSEQTPIEETVAAMADLRQSGKIRAIGLSNVTSRTSVELTPCTRSRRCSRSTRWSSVRSSR